MSQSNSPTIVLNDLMFYFDASNPKSWAGRPTNNIVPFQNPRIDASYASYSATSSGTWNAKHPDAIRVYSINDGSEITGYVNTGVTDYSNTYHAIWTYDPQLNKPVVTMRDVDGIWKAKSFGLGQTWNSLGVGAGNIYTISWLSWTDDITKCANAGIYSMNASNSWNFWDGQSNSQSTAFNTKPRTWQRVYATFTIASGLNYSSGLSCYMYGHYGNRGTVKIADVQIEIGSVSGFTSLSSRTSSNALIDLTGNSSITPSLTYNSDGSFSFNGSSNFLSMGASTYWSFGANGTVEQWVYIAGNSGSNDRLWCVNNNSSSLDAYLNGSTYNVYFHGGIVGTTTTIPSGQWVHLAVTYVNGTMSVYFNGVSQPLTGTTTGYNITTNTNFYVGRYQSGGYYLNGKINSMRVYKKGLSASEVRTNFQAGRGRFGV